MTRRSLFRPRIVAVIAAVAAVLVAGPVTAAGKSESLNWAGYVDLPHGGTVTAVSGQFVVPSVASPVPPGLSSTWVGIGGWNTGDLIQAGVEEDTVDIAGSGKSYTAWYELLPDAETPLSGCHPQAACDVRPGDHVSVSIRKIAANRWRIAMSDAGRWSWTKTLSYASTGSSAEWIAEATSLVAVPTLYGNLSRVTFDKATYTVSGHGTHVIAAGHPLVTEVSPTGGVFVEATPSRLDRQGDGFAVCAYTSSCAAPTR